MTLLTVLGLTVKVALAAVALALSVNVNVTGVSVATGLGTTVKLLPVTVPITGTAAWLLEVTK